MKQSKEKKNNEEEEEELFRYFIVYILQQYTVCENVGQRKGSKAKLRDINN